MPQYTLAEAAKATGRSKSTVLRSIRAGRISAVRDALSGGWLIEPSELHRLYPATDDAVRGTGNDTPRNGHGGGDDAELRARLADALDQISDLRRRLDRSEEERRQGADRLTAAQERIAALMDQRVVAQAPVRRSWWRFGGR